MSSTSWRAAYEATQLRSQSLAGQLRVLQAQMVHTDAQVTTARANLKEQALLAYLAGGAPIVSQLPGRPGLDKSLTVGYAEIVSGGQQRAVNAYQVALALQAAQSKQLTAAHDQAIATLSELQSERNAAAASADDPPADPFPGPGPAGDTDRSGPGGPGPGRGGRHQASPGGPAGPASRQPPTGRGHGSRRGDDLVQHGPVGPGHHRASVHRRQPGDHPFATGGDVTPVDGAGLAGGRGRRSTPAHRPLPPRPPHRRPPRRRRRRRPRRRPATAPPTAPPPPPTTAPAPSPSVGGSPAPGASWRSPTPTPSWASPISGPAPALTPSTARA